MVHYKLTPETVLMVILDESIRQNGPLQYDIWSNRWKSKFGTMLFNRAYEIGLNISHIIRVGDSVEFERLYYKQIRCRYQQFNGCYKKYCTYIHTEDEAICRMNLDGLLFNNSRLTTQDNIMSTRVENLLKKIKTRDERIMRLNEKIDYMHLAEEDAKNKASNFETELSLKESEIVKMRDEIEELKTDSVEKLRTKVEYLEGQVISLTQENKDLRTKTDEYRKRFRDFAESFSFEPSKKIKI